MILRALSSPLARSVVVVLMAAAVPGSAALAANPVGASWTLAQDRSGHQCPITLRFDAAGAAGALAMPAGCRRAFPALLAARTWSIGDDGSIQFRDATGQSLLTLARHPEGAWLGDDESGHSYTLTPPTAASSQAALPETDGAEPAGQGPVALADPQIMAGAPPAQPLDRGVVRLAAATAKAAAASEPAAAGRYAVMRGDRDTGCMVTLEGAGKGASRARLAPACRDQGITIFDPVSWHMKGSSLVLVARKGHSVELDRNESGVWVKTPQDAKALGLKPL